MNGNWKYCPYCGKPIRDCECDSGHDERFPAGYAELEFEDYETPEAVAYGRFADMNFLRYYER